jgi:hypothetical protein
VEQQMAEHTEQHDPLEAIFHGLGNKNQEERLKHAIDLRNYVG